MTGPMRYIAKRIAEKYRKMSIQRVISLFFTIVTALGMIFMGATLFFRFSDTLAAMSADSTQRVLSQVNFNLDSYLRRVMRISDALYYRVIKNVDFAQQPGDEILSSAALLYEENRDVLVSMALFAQDGSLLASVPFSQLKENAAPQESLWFTQAMTHVENLEFSAPHIQRLFQDPDAPYRWVVSLSRHVQLTSDGRIKSGVLLVDMSFSGIEQVCSSVQLPNGGYLYLVDHNGEIIYHPRQQMIYSGLQTENYLQAASYSDGTHTELFEGQRRHVTVKTVGYTGWKLVAVVPVAGLWQDSGQLVLFGVSMLLFSVFLMAFLNFRISAYISDPIRRLEHEIEEVKKGKERMELVEGGCYEVQKLSRSVFSMVSTMRHLTEDILQQERQKRRKELDVLQSQINPHFLYNTLDSIVWMTEAGRYQESIEMVTSLARFFRISLSKGRSMIPLADELEHARHYMNIQKIRYKNKFEFSMQIHPDTEGLYALKLSIQPILENAIYHGISGLDEDGEIRVEALRDKEDLVIRISDNGAGIPPAVAQTLLEEERPASHSKGSGIGLRNVHRRLRLYFGESYGLTVHSEPDEGTMVELRMPALDRQQAQQYGREDVL